MFGPIGRYDIPPFWADVHAYSSGGLLHWPTSHLGRLFLDQKRHFPLHTSSMTKNPSESVHDLKKGSIYGTKRPKKHQKREKCQKKYCPAISLHSVRQPRSYRRNLES